MKLCLVALMLQGTRVFQSSEFLYHVRDIPFCDQLSNQYDTYVDFGMEYNATKTG